MKRERRWLMVYLLMVLLNGNPALAQDGGPQVRKEAADMDVQSDLNLTFESTFKFFGSKYFAKVIKSAPYSATAITEHVQTLGDGNQIIRKNEVKLYRDSEGRTRREQKLESIGKWTAAGDAPQVIYINDPVAGISYNLDPRTRTARKSTNAIAFKQAQRVDEKVSREFDARVKPHETRIKEQEARVKEQAREREAHLKEQAKEIEARRKEHEKEHEAWVKAHERELEQRTKEHEEQMKKFMKEREQWTKEHEKLLKEQMKILEQQDKEIRKLEKEKIDKEIHKPGKVDEKIFKPGATESLKVGAGKKEISSSDGKKKIESLGKRTVEGVEAEGTRSTRTIPAGEIGNTLPIAVVDENWYSAELQLQVMTKHSDPRSGVTTYRLTNIKRGEPDRSLFEIPADYTLVEDSSFRKRLTKPAAATKPSAPGSPSEPAKPIESPKKPEPKKAPESHL